jgi:hypothetical protein
MTSSPDIAVDQYRREARRCRGRGRSDVRQVHARLRELNRRFDAARSPLAAEILPPPTADRYEDFASQVAASLEAGLLRYSSRKRLIKEALGMGIGAFEANVLMAAVQHGGANNATSTPAKWNFGQFWPYGIAGLIQATLILAVWRLVT